jgi:3-isopropylmalate dehydrogenase
VSKVLVLAGDGIGPEVTDAALEVLEAVCPDLDVTRQPIGLACLEAEGAPYRSDLIDVAREQDAVLLGAVGGATHGGSADWDMRPEAGLFALRKGLDLFANLRPIKPLPGAPSAAAVDQSAVEGLDLLIVRELAGGLYFGEKGREPGSAFDTCSYTEAEIERVLRRAFELAAGRRGQLCSVDKANVMRTGELWREVAERMEGSYPDVEVEHLLVDNAAMQLLLRPTSFDVIVTENLFGDVLSDEAAALAGGLGVAASASLGEGTLGLYEPVHGSAPDIAGSGIANPVAAILSVALMLRYSLDDEPGARAVERAVEDTTAAGIRTPDLGGTAATSDVVAAIRDRLHADVAIAPDGPRGEDE